MLTFLRRIRKGLLGSGTTPRYLPYAIGEIALVVIGILIALQINNWNQARLNVIEEKRIMVTIAEEINTFRWQATRGLNTYNEILASADRLISVINVPTLEVLQDTIDHDLSILTTRWLMGMSNEVNIYDALSNAGELRLLSSPELRKLLGSLKRNIMLLSKYEVYQTNFVENQLFPFLNQHIDGITISDIRSKIRTDRYEYNPAPIELSINKSRFSTSYEELITSKFFSNLLLQHMKNTAVLLPIYQRLQDKISQIDSILMEYDPSLIRER